MTATGETEESSQIPKKETASDHIAFGTFSDKEIDDFLAKLKVDLSPEGSLQRTLSETSSATQTAVLQFRSLQGEVANKLRRVGEPAHE